MEMDESDYRSLSQVRAQGQKRRLPEQERVPGAQPASKKQAIQDGNENNSPQEIASLELLPDELTAHILCCLVESEKHPLELVKTLINFGKTNKRNFEILDDMVVWNKIKQTYKTDPLKLAKVCVYAGNQSAIICLQEVLSANPHLLNDLKKMITNTNLDADLVDKHAEPMFRRVLSSLTKCGQSGLIDLDVLLDALKMNATQGGIKTSRLLVSYLCDSHECDLKKLIRGNRPKFGINSKIWPLAIEHDNPEIFALFRGLTTYLFDPNHEIKRSMTWGPGIKFNVFKNCLENGASPNTIVDPSGGTNLLIMAIFKESRNAIQMLLKKGADVNARATEKYYRYTPLMFAIEKSDGIFQDLIDAGADVNAQDSLKLPVLHIAATKPKTKGKIVSLLNAGVDVNQICPDGNTAVMMAVLNDQVEAIDTLIENGANVDIKDAQGMTPLFYAAANGNKPMVEALLKGNPTIDMRNTEGKTPLMYAAACCLTEQKPMDELLELITTLKDAGADINARDSKSLTALALVIVKKADPRMISVLIKAGADARHSCGDGNGVTLLQLAAANGNVDAIRLLLAECATSPAERQKARGIAKHFGQNDALGLLQWHEMMLRQATNSNQVNKG